MAKIFLIDVTNRDGVQTAKLGLAKLEKTMINVYLNEMGVFQSEFGFPTTNHETNYLKANIRLADMEVLAPMRLEGWIRGIPEDVEITHQKVPELKHINLSVSTSDQMINGKYLGKRHREDITKEMIEGVLLAKKYGMETIGVNSEDGSRTDMDYLLSFGMAAKKAGACRLRYCDTLGYDNPFTIYDTMHTLAEHLEMPIEVHCHGDLGMAVANSLAGAKGVIDGGQDCYINTTVNGIGERAGNADLVAVVLALEKSKDFAKRYAIANPIDLSKAWKIARFASYAFGIPIPINQPGVGANAFAHASGIHADGVLKDADNYELYSFSEVGRGEPETVETGRQIITGEYSGISGFRHIMGQMAVTFANADEAQQVLELARYANVESQSPLVEDELVFIAKYPEIAKQLLTLDPLTE
jgi:isopropylmalate/homocitrate/citramalate synthase